MRRRTFVQRAVGTGLVASPLGLSGAAAEVAAGQPDPGRALAEPVDAAATVLGRDDAAERAAWVARATRIATPVLPISPPAR